MCVCVCVCMFGCYRNQQENDNDDDGAQEKLLCVQFTQFQNDILFRYIERGLFLFPYG